jgi:hypothetical protein
MGTSMCISRLSFRAAVLLALWLSLCATGASAANLLDMSEKLDKSDQMDFTAAVDKARACTRSRDFPCAETEINKAGRLAGNAKDRQTLASARDGLAAEKQKVENERLAAESRERERQAAAARERESGSSSSNSSRSGAYTIFPGQPTKGFLDDGYTWRGECNEGSRSWVVVTHGKEYSVTKGYIAWGSQYGSGVACCTSVGEAFAKACRGETK